ncbi:hypothetical protein [Piscinibacter sp.]|uniref:hypothetical protein n=1 Tax=Piscinibacter sp. TaxID=1903157 RepID=UPI0025EF3305|nr:hypothetical protein [Piscinibacter sp.]
MPYWLGAAFIRLLGGCSIRRLAARLPFALLLALALALTWYATYHLARTEAAQPVPFAFGGEADPVDYARALADGAVLALMATLGLLQLGHETTPELAQLARCRCSSTALAAAPRSRAAPAAALLALPVLAGSGAPSHGGGGDGGPASLLALQLCPGAPRGGGVAAVLAAGLAPRWAWRWRVPASA